MAKLIETNTEFEQQDWDNTTEFCNNLNDLSGFTSDNCIIEEYDYIDPFYTMFVTEKTDTDAAEQSDRRKAMIVNILVSGRTETDDGFNPARICSARRNTWLNKLSKDDKPLIATAVFFPNMSRDANLICPFNQLTEHCYFKDDFDNLGFEGVVKNLLDELWKKGLYTTSYKSDCLNAIKGTADKLTPYQGETMVSDSFKKLPSSEFVYFPEFSNNDSNVCDFLMLVKDYGFIIFEVKGWSEDTVYNAEKNKFKCDEQGGNPANQANRYKKALSEILKDNVFFTDRDIDSHIRCVCAFPKIGKNHAMAKPDSTDYNLYKHCYENGVMPLFEEDLADPKLADKLKGLFEKADLTGTQYENCRRIIEPGYDNLSAAEGDYSHLQVWDKALSYDDINAVINAWCRGIKQIHFVRSEDDIKGIKLLLQKRMEELGIAPDGAYLKHGEVGKEAFNKNYISVFRFEAYVLPEGVNTVGFKIINAYENKLLKKIAALHNINKAQIEKTEDKAQIENPEGGIFNLEQYLVEHEQADVNTAVTAGAGTGKTQTMASRIMYLCYEASMSGVNRLSDDIVLITFTNEAADEMRTRLKRMFHSQYLLTRDRRFLRYSEDTENMHIGTIHSFIKKIIQNTSTALGVGSDFNINNSLYKYKKILAKEIDEYAPDVWKGYYKSSVIDAIAEIGKKIMDGGADISADTRNIAANKNPANVDEWLHDNLFLVLRDSYKEYRRQVRENNGVLLSEYANAFRICVDSPSFSPALFGFKYLFIDEFQDTDIYQVDGFAALMKKLGTARLFVVGDLKQSIYQFRGADGDSFTKIEKGEPKSWREHSLVLNYRSGKVLINTFNDYTDNVYNSTNSSIYKDCKLKSAKNITSNYNKYNIGTNNKKDNIVTLKEAVIESLINKLEEEIGKNKDFGKGTVILVRTNGQVNDVIKAAKAAGLTIKTPENKSDDFYSHTAAIDLYFLLSALTHPNQAEYLYMLLYSNYMRVGIEKQKNTPAFTPQSKVLDKNATDEERSYYSDNYNAFYPNYKETGDNDETPKQTIAEKLKQTINDCIGHMIYNNDSNSLEEYWNEISEDKTSDGKPVDYWNEICTQISNKGEAVSVLKIIYNLYMLCEPFRITSDPEGYKNDFSLLLDTIASEFKDTQLTLDNLYESIKLKVQTHRPLNNTPDTDAENSDNAITCMTVHKAKGMQFKNVYVLLFNKSDDKDYSYTNVNVDANMITEVSGQIVLTKISFDNNNNVPGKVSGQIMPTKINPDNNNNVPGKDRFSFSFTFGKNNVNYTNDKDDIEEKNILYVALTRAEENISVYYSEYNELVDYLPEKEDNTDE